jgi:LPS-assembly protein
MTVARSISDTNALTRAGFRVTLPSMRALSLVCVILWPAAAPAQELMCPQLGADIGESLPAPPDDRLRVSADKVDMTRDGLSTLAGTVRLVQGGNRIEAEALAYDSSNQTVRLTAESLFRNRDLVVRSQQAELDLANETGTFHHAEFTLIDRAARGEAESVSLTRAGTVEIEDVYYTTCAPGSRAWFLEASEIELDREAGLGTAKHARLRFGYVPVLYTPWFQFPIDDRRRSGLLFPTLGDSDNTGFDARIPFYLNLAPNYDAQVTPRYMARRGTQVGTEGRYLFRNNTGRAAYEYLDEDRVEGIRRSYFNFDHLGLINRRLALAARYGEVSDSGYFEDLGGRLEASSITHLERSAQLTYAAPAAYTLAARVIDYQTVATTTLTPETEPYKRLPEVRAEAITRKARLGTRLGIDGQYVNFVRETPPEGQRMVLDPFLRFVHDRSAWYVASQLDVHYTRYEVKTDPDDPTAPPTQPTRTLPRFNLDGGLRFERLSDAGNLQTLEPRLYYLYVPYREQDSLPVFDTGEPDFDFVQIFERNRYSGLDRVADANHIALVMTSRTLEPFSGVQRFRGSIGQIYRFDAPRVLAPASTGPATDKGGTDFIGELDYRLPFGLALNTNGQWSTDRNEFVRGSGAIRYRHERMRADLAYRYREFLPLTGAPLEQIDLSAGTPLFGGLAAIGRWRLSRDDNRTIEALGGLEYETCCWALRGAYRRYQFGYDTILAQPEYTTGMYFQLELKGLTRIGAGFQALLPPLD